MKTYFIEILGSVLVVLALTFGVSYYSKSRENKQFKEKEIERKFLIDEKKKEILLFETQQQDKAHNAKFTKSGIESH